MTIKGGYVQAGVLTQRQAKTCFAEVIRLPHAWRTAIALLTCAPPEFAFANRTAHRLVFANRLRIAVPVLLAGTGWRHMDMASKTSFLGL